MGSIEKVLCCPDEKLKHSGYGRYVQKANYVEWEYKGVKCQIVRRWVLVRYRHNKNHLFGGYLYGYIEIPKDHPWSNQGYDINADVQGGCTYNYITPYGKTIVGFDRAYSCDITPSLEKMLKKINCDLLKKFKKWGVNKYSNKSQRSYKNMTFCIEQCKSLVDQMLNQLSVKNEESLS